MEREPLRFVNVMERSPLQYLSKTFTHSSKVTLPNIRKGFVKVTFPSHLQYLNGSLSKSLRSLKVYFRAVVYACMVSIYDKYVISPAISCSSLNHNEIEKEEAPLEKII